MITYHSNIGTAFNSLAQRLRMNLTKENISRKVAIGLVGEVRNRIHVEGKAADGSQIGTYTPEYMVVRTGAFQNNKISRGKNKGKARITRAGVFTKGENKGEPRPNYGRNSDTKVVLSLTTKMEMDFTAMPDGEGKWGLGFHNDLSKQKADWNNERYGHKVYALTTGEEAKANDAIQELLNSSLNN